MTRNNHTHPAPPPTVREALLEFYQRHNYGDEGGINKKIAWIRFGHISLPFPNVAGRRNYVYLHDVHHIVTGYNTTWKGESAVSAWEIAAGGWKRVYVIWIMALWAMGLGVLFYPRHTLRAFRQGLTMRNALTCGLTKNAMYNLSVPALRTLMHDHPRTGKKPWLWIAISLLVFMAPFVNGLLFIWAVFHFVI